MCALKGDFQVFQLRTCKCCSYSSLLALLVHRVRRCGASPFALAASSRCPRLVASTNVLLLLFLQLFLFVLLLFLLFVQVLFVVVSAVAGQVVRFAAASEARLLLAGGDLLMFVAIIMCALNFAARRAMFRFHKVRLQHVVTLAAADIRSEGIAASCRRGQLFALFALLAKFCVPAAGQRIGRVRVTCARSGFSHWLCPLTVGGRLLRLRFLSTVRVELSMQLMVCVRLTDIIGVGQVGGIVGLSLVHVVKVANMMLRLLLVLVLAELVAGEERRRLLLLLIAAVGVLHKHCRSRIACRELRVAAVRVLLLAVIMHLMLVLIVLIVGAHLWNGRKQSLTCIRI